MRKALCFMMPLLASLVTQAGAAQGPTVVQRSLILNTYDHGRYWPDPNKEPVYGKPAWTPNNLNLDFLVEGPLSAGSHLTLEFLRPDGKLWVSSSCKTPAIEAGKVDNIECEDIDEHKALPMTGMFGIQIRQVNELEGINSVIYKGRFKVGSYVSKYADKSVNHYIDEDWRLPVAHVALNESADANAPILYSYFWFKGRDVDGDNMVAHLFREGKAVAISSDFGGRAQSSYERHSNLEPKDPKQDYSYEYWYFAFTKVRGFVNNTGSMDPSQWFLLNQNPGNYEIKVLHKGALVRHASFTVGADGRIVAKGSAEKDGNGNTRVLIPTKVLGTIDGVWDKNAYKTEVYYGNANAQTAGILAP